MNYNAFAIPVKGFLIDNNRRAIEIRRASGKPRQQIPPATAAVMQNLVDSHDTDRLASMIVNGEGTVYDGNPGNRIQSKQQSTGIPKIQIRKPNERERNIQRLVVLLQMDYVGAPMIYYGDEAGMWGGGDPDDRMPMVWQDKTTSRRRSTRAGSDRDPDEVKFDDGPVPILQTGDCFAT